MIKRGGDYTTAKNSTKYRTTPATNTRTNACNRKLSENDREIIKEIHVDCQTLITTLNTRYYEILTALTVDSADSVNLVNLVQLVDELKVIDYLRNLFNYLDPLKPRHFKWNYNNDDGSKTYFLDVLKKHGIIDAVKMLHFDETSFIPIVQKFPNMIPEIQHPLISNVLTSIAYSGHMVQFDHCEVYLDSVENRKQSDNGFFDLTI